jgi:hypothetical protein
MNHQISSMMNSIYPPSLGFISRSNSQPDLTLNIEKPVPNTSSSIYNGGGGGFGGANGGGMLHPSGMSSGFSHHSQQQPQQQAHYGLNANACGGPNTSANINSVYGAQTLSGAASSSSSGSFGSQQPPHSIQSNVFFNSKKIRRHPSLTHKSSMSDLNEEIEIFSNGFNFGYYQSQMNAANANLQAVNNSPNSYANYAGHDAGNVSSSSNLMLNNMSMSSNANDFCRDSFSPHTSNNNQRSNSLLSQASTQSQSQQQQLQQQQQQQNQQLYLQQQYSLPFMNNTADDGLLLGIDAITADFLNTCGDFSGIFENIPDPDDLSLVTFETSSTSSSTCSSSAGGNGKNAFSSTISSSSSSNGNQHSLPQPHQLLQYHSSYQQQPVQLKQTQCDINLPNTNPLSNFYEYCGFEDELVLIDKDASNLINNVCGETSTERTTRSAPPSPTPQRKKQRPTGSSPWNKPWYQTNEIFSSLLSSFIILVY